MNIIDLLDRPIAYHRVFATLTGSVKAAVFLSQAVYWQKRAKQADGWWYKTAEEWEEETGLSRHEQDTARKACEKYLKSDLRSVPATLFWKVDEEALSADLLAESGQSSLPESGKQERGKAANINRNTETTTETTTEDIDSQIFTALENLTGGLNTSAPRFVDTWKEKHPVERIMEAIALAKTTGRKPVQYVDSILIGWEANGYPKSRDEKIQAAKKNGATYSPKQPVSVANAEIIKMAAQQTMEKAARNARH